jgi:pyruvate-formate lyase-activating enzyme
MASELVVLNQAIRTATFPVLPVVPAELATAQPESFTILPTYRCNAACRECCFESHPGIKHRMSRDELLGLIRRVREELPSVRYVVLTGGEVTLLRKDLLDAISLLTELGLGSRIVTNGHWARTDSDAARWVKDLISAGLAELNLSTGDEHLEWVPTESVARAALHAARNQLLTIVTIEGTADAKFRLEEFRELSQIREVLRDDKLRRWLVVMTNVWMPFHSNSGIRQDEDITEAKGCDNIFDNFVVNPYGNLMSCCGLTMEYIPEMKVGHVSEPATLQQVYGSQFDDLLKLWIWLDGTRAIFELARLRCGQPVEPTSPHHCAICAQLYQNPQLRSTIQEMVIQKAGEIVFRSSVKARLNGRVGPRNKHYVNRG